MTFATFVAGVVVDDEMDVELDRYVSFDVTQEGEELLVPSAQHAGGLAPRFHNILDSDGHEASWLRPRRCWTVGLGLDTTQGSASTTDHRHVCSPLVIGLCATVARQLYSTQSCTASLPNAEGLDLGARAQSDVEIQAGIMSPRATVLTHDDGGQTKCARFLFARSLSCERFLHCRCSNLVIAESRSQRRT